MSVRRGTATAIVLLVVGAIGLGAQGPPPAIRTFSSPADYVPDPSTVLSSTSELRDLVERFGDDRAAILRFHVIPGSPTRRERMRAFYDAWLVDLRKMTFDGLSQEGRPTTSC